MLRRQRVGWRLLLLTTPALSSCFPTLIRGEGRYLPRPAVKIAAESTGPPQLPSLDTPFNERQLEIDGPFTFTLPLPAPTPTNPNTSPLPLLLSPYFPYASTKSISSSPTSTTSLTSSTSTQSAATNSNAKSNANNNNSTSPTRLTAATFFPFILLTSIFLVALMAWCLHGWCTRRPKFVSADKTAGNKEERRRGWFSFSGNVGREGEELITGPEYNRPGTQDMGYPMGRDRTERFKWPSISLAERQGYRYRLSPKDDERNDLPNANILNRSPAETRVTDKLKRNPPSASTVGITSPTSIALKELYEAVLKSGLSSPASELRRECDEWRKDEEEEKTTLLGLISASGSGVTSPITSGQKRRRHVRHDSSGDLLWSAHGTSARGSGSGTKLEVRNPSVGEGRLGLRESDGEEEDLVDVELGGRAKKLPEDEDGYTPLPTPTRVPPRSGRPALVSNGTGLSFILPEHPKQITSPPLESQILFVPIVDGLDMITSPSRKSSYVRPKTKLKPKPTSRERYAVVDMGPKDPEMVNGAKGKLVKTAKARENTRAVERMNPQPTDSERKQDSRGDVETLLHREDEDEDKALKRVEKIMERGWLQRSMAG